jgi:hypothetical protein
MKKLLFFISGLLAASTSWAQQLQGYYLSSSSGFESYLLFFECNNFVFSESGCTGMSKGKGTFIVLHDTLQLRFSNPDGPMPLVASCSNQPPTRLGIQVIEGSSGESLPGVSIYITPTPSGTSQIGTSTTVTGQAWLDYTPLATDTLIVGFVGYATQRIPLTGLGGKCLKVALTHTYYLDASTIQRFPLERLRRASFTAHLSQDEKSSYAHLRFKRVSAGKAKRFFQEREQQ